MLVHGTEKGPQKQNIGKHGSAVFIEQLFSSSRFSSLFLQEKQENKKYFHTLEAEGIMSGTLTSSIPIFGGGGNENLETAKFCAKKNVGNVEI